MAYEKYPLTNSTRSLGTELDNGVLWPTHQDCNKFGSGSINLYNGNNNVKNYRRRSEGTLHGGATRSQDNVPGAVQLGSTSSYGETLVTSQPVRKRFVYPSASLVNFYHHKLRRTSDPDSLMEQRSSTHHEYVSLISNEIYTNSKDTRKNEETTFYDGEQSGTTKSVSASADGSIIIKIDDCVSRSKRKEKIFPMHGLPKEEITSADKVEVDVVSGIDADTGSDSCGSDTTHNILTMSQRKEGICRQCNRVTYKSHLNTLDTNNKRLKRLSLQETVLRKLTSVERSPVWNGGVKECGRQGYHCAYHICAPLKLTIHTDKTVNIQTSVFGQENRSESHDDDDDTNTVREDGRCTGVGGRRNAANANFLQYIMDLITPSDNKLSMKLFGSRKAVMKEKRRQKDEGRLIIHPCSAFRFYWDIIMLCLLIANVILLPLAISFFHSGEQSKFWSAFNLLSDTMFILDIILNFRTGVILNNYVDEIILDPKQIARHYLRGWFIVDVMSSFPVDYIFFLLEKKQGGYQLARTGRAIKAIRLFRLLSLLRLLRVSRLVRYASQWEEFFSVATIAMRIFNLIGLIVLIAHWNGCLQFLVPCIQDFPADSWVAVNNLQNATWTKQYTLALFKALSHMLSIGYGRFPPKSYTDMWLTMLSMIVGAIVYATTIGHVSALVQSFDTSGRQYNEKIRKVEEYMLWRKLPRQLRTRILDYYEHRYQGKMFDETLILSELSKRLYLDVVNHNCITLVSSVPFFVNAEQNFIDNIITKLEFEMFQPGDIIIAEGSFGDKMYFIQEGVLDIIKANGELVTTLSDGSYFGEISLILKTRRTANVRAVTYCNLYSLSSLDVDKILQQFPSVKRTFAVIAAERLSKLGMNIANCRHADKSLEDDAKIVADLLKGLEDSEQVNKEPNKDDND